jgi:hypothetical protein
MVAADAEVAEGAPEPLRIVTDSLPDVESGAPVTLTLEAGGGTGVALTWAVASGELPDGLDLDDQRGTRPLWTGAWQTTGSNPLLECSGLAASASNEGILWIHEDSSGPPEVVAVREDGSVVHRLRIVSFVNEPDYRGSFAVDFEDIAVGAGPVDGLDYLYVADTGDNLGVRRPPTDTLRILRIAEPELSEAIGETSDVSAEAFNFTYPSDSSEPNRFDAEVLFLDWETGTPYVVTKRNGLGSGYVYKLPMPLSPDWTSDNPVTAIAVGDGPLALPPWPTAGDSSRDGQRVVLRTYLAECYEYYRPASGLFDDIFAGDADLRLHRFDCPSGPKHEAISYSGDGTELYTATEGEGTPIERVNASAGAMVATITGAPERGGVFTFVVEVRDSSGRRASREFVLEVTRDWRPLPVFMPYVLAY